ncbi:unnamed protein product [Symbiodinium natans]|uniref:Protein phosphatase n=1 Tax=Symbiodinium natans TaxID=878477 RepID=A0A812JEJ0_9DINO|nr:unnamed protein product [Symbiodinium natans]
MAPVAAKLKADNKALLRAFYTRLSYQPECEAHSLSLLKFLSRSGVQKEKEGPTPVSTQCSTVTLTTSEEEATVPRKVAAPWTRGITCDGGQLRETPSFEALDKFKYGLKGISNDSAAPSLAEVTRKAEQEPESTQPRMVRERRRSSEYLSSLCTGTSPFLEHVEPLLMRWPQEVHELLHRPMDFHPRASPKDPELRSLKFHPGAFSIAHPDKVNKHGNEDSYFVGDNLRCLGVADGVGEWGWRFGINARHFADELMWGCRDFLTAHNPCDVSEDLSQHVLEALKKAHQQTKSLGSATALVTALGRGGQLGIASLGDSALAVLRREEVGGGMCCICRTEEQQVKFNQPRQLARFPDPADYPKLMREGKESLVKAMQKSTGRKDDGPEDSQLLSFSVREGDVLVLGTDGLWDNLYMPEVCNIVAAAVGPLEVENGHFTEAAQIAEALAKAAHWRSLSRDARTPFSVHGRKAGIAHTGGKMDDITCVCAWVLADRQ